MTYMKDDSGGYCSMLDACQYPEDSAAAIQRLLTRNFLRHYTSPTKAPLPLFYHAAWFRLRPHREEALLNFLDSILELPDVYLVTSQQLLSWVSNPSPLPTPHPALQCHVPSVSQACTNPQKCSYGAKHLVTCDATR